MEKQLISKMHLDGEIVKKGSERPNRAQELHVTRVPILRYIPQCVILCKIDCLQVFLRKDRSQS